MKHVYFTLLAGVLCGFAASGQQAVGLVSDNANAHLQYESDLPERFIVYRGFVVRYDTAHRVPLFTIHRVTPEQLQDSAGHRAARSDDFWIDDRLSAFSASARDYYKSGYDRGHHAPAGDFVRSQRLQDESFVYSNISPQNPKLNRGVFSDLEKEIRLRVEQCTCDAYVVTGTFFSADAVKTIGDRGVGVPDVIYKLAYYPAKKTAIAFQFPNNLERYGRLAEYQKTVDDIEQLTGEDFFDALPDETENKLERQKRRF